MGNVQYSGAVGDFIRIAALGNTDADDLQRLACDLLGEPQPAKKPISHQSQYDRECSTFELPAEVIKARAGIIPHDPQDDEPDDDDESNRMDTDEPTASDRGTARAIIAEMEQLPRPQDVPGYFDRTGPDGQYPART